MDVRIVQKAERQNPRSADVAVAQLLDLARLANVGFEVIDGRLAMCAAKLDVKLWPPLRRCLDEIGTGAIVDYLSRTSPAERQVLAAAA